MRFFLRESEKGQGLVEYSLLAVLVTTVVVAVILLINPEATITPTWHIDPELLQFILSWF